MDGFQRELVELLPRLRRFARAVAERIGAPLTERLREEAERLRRTLTDYTELEATLRTLKLTDNCMGRHGLLALAAAVQRWQDTVVAGWYVRFQGACLSGGRGGGVRARAWRVYA